MTAIHSADVLLFDRFRQALNIPQTANPSAADLLSKIRRLQQALSRTVDELDRRDQQLTSALDPWNWVAVWHDQNPPTVLDHGNLLTLDGTGQVLLEYRPPAGTGMDDAMGGAAPERC
jgi:hypothetical protein